MSHFTVLVIGDDVEGQLQPFHEFECTGEDDRFVQDIDETEEAREKFASLKKRMYVDQNGKQFDAYDDRFYRDPTPEEKKKIGSMGGTGGGHGMTWTSKDWGDGCGYKTKVHFMPEGWKEIEEERCKYQTFAEFIQGYYGHDPVPFGTKPDLSGKHKYGYVQLDRKGEVVKVINRTNPNKKWDWYKIGGRWNGFFHLKPEKDRNFAYMKADPHFSGHVGKGDADQCHKGDINFDFMRKHRGREAKKEYNEIANLFGGEIPKLELRWNDVLADKLIPDIEDKRKKYGAQPIIKKMKVMYKEKEKYTKVQKDFIVWGDLEHYQMSCEEYVKQAEDKQPVTFAVLKDGEWFERGQMGWWACVSNEKENGVWEKEWNALVMELPDDTLVTVVDCHI